MLDDLSVHPVTFMSVMSGENAAQMEAADTTVEVESKKDGQSSIFNKT